jgi:hypothetical protein
MSQLKLNERAAILRWDVELAHGITYRRKAVQHGQSGICQDRWSSVSQLAHAYSDTTIIQLYGRVYTRCFCLEAGKQARHVERVDRRSPREVGSLSQRKRPRPAIRIRRPRLGEAGTDLTPAVDAYQGFQELPKEEPFAVVRGIQGVCQLDRLAQHYGERLGMRGGVRRQAALVLRLRRNGRWWRRLWSATDQREQENAASCGRR